MYWLCKYVLIGPLLRWFARPTIVGTEHVPAKGPVIVAANHLAVIDSFLLVLVLRRRVTFIAKSQYFTEPGVKGAFKRAFFGSCGQIPVDRSGSGAGDPALDAAVGLLRDGRAWGIHPEGSRSPCGALHSGRTGVMRVALATGAPVIPVVLSGTAEVNPIGSRRWRRGHTRIVFLPALDLSGYDDDRDSIRAATDHLMDVIAAESGQRHVDHYVTDCKTA